MNRRFVVAMPLVRYRVRYRGQKSSALVLVLGCLVFLCVLVVAFFASVSVERQSAQFYANSSSVKLLSDSAVDIVMGQIKDATKGTDSSGNTLSWASQPGMIRNYNTQGAAAAYYKLYSWANMVGAGAFNASGSELPPSTWASSPALYTDLNDPVSGVYPIVDPSATNSVIGFSIDSANANASTRDAAPMPVQWLYVLKDGSIASASGTAGNTVTVAGAGTGDKQIVARVAFWTDDETSKINVNTAAGDFWTNSASPGGQGNPGAFWDTPRMYGSFEYNYLALNQPIRGEFQRYPGHPASTYLSAAFPGMSTNNLWAMTPRVNGGGSVGGSVSVNNSSTAVNSYTSIYGTPPSNLPNTDGVPQKTDRLYASMDELMFSTNLNITSTATNRIGNPLGSAPITKSQVQNAKFFLTAHSRAPEVNLYNQPRIVTWPVSALTPTTNYQTTYDRLIAFCGSLYNTNAYDSVLRTNAYYFQRYDSTNAINDLPGSEGPVPTGVRRNRQLYTYLQNLTKLPEPGFSTSGETFLSKYPKNTANLGNPTATGRDQILTEIFDYIRSINTQDVSAWPTMTNTFTPNVPPGVNSDTQQPAGAAQVVPIYDVASNTRGFGRYPTIIEAGLLFFGVGQTAGTGITTNFPPYSTTNGTPYNATGFTGTTAFSYIKPNDGFPATEGWCPTATNYAAAGGTLTNAAPGMTRVQSALLANVFDPSMGFASPEYNIWVEYSGLDQFKWNNGAGTDLNMFSRSATTNIIMQSYSQYGGYVGMRTALGGAGNTEKHHNVDNYNLGGSSGLQGFAAFANYSVPLDCFTGATRDNQIIHCTGGTLTIKIRAAATAPAAFSLGTPGPVIQTITMVFPPFHCPVPALSPFVQNSTVNNGVPVVINVDYRDVAQRLSQAAPTPICDRDVYRGMVLDASQADGRTVAGMTNVPSNYFIPGPYYGTTVSSGVTIGGNGMVETSHGGVYPYLGTYFGRLVPGVNYSPATGATNQGTFSSSTYTLSGCQSNNLLYPGTTISGQTVGTNGPNVSVMAPVVFNSSSTTSINAQGANGVFAGGGTSASLPPGDWDTGTAQQPDGAYINKADAGNASTTDTPYFSYPKYNSYLISPSFFSPNRQMPSPAMFGSLPTGIISQKPWQTLLFRPDPGTANGGTSGHYGATSPADHLLLDLFNMPVVEPYPISDPFSTAGKINMNYQIVPFTYITRSTAVQAVLRSEMLLAIPDKDGVNSYNIYKSSNAATNNRRYFIDLAKTLTGFTTRFATGDIFRSASEICNIWLVPAGTPTVQTYLGMQNFWKMTTGANTGPNNGALTGDNVRERPYANIYPRLTTKSNTFTVHYRVETLKKVPSTAVTQFVEGTDVVTGSFRGSTTLERYLDTSDTRIPDYASVSQTPTPTAIDNFYKFRVLETKQFTP